MPNAPSWFNIDALVDADKRAEAAALVKELHALTPRIDKLMTRVYLLHGRINAAINAATAPLERPCPTDLADGVMAAILYFSGCDAVDEAATRLFEPVSIVVQGGFDPSDPQIVRNVPWLAEADAILEADGSVPTNAKDAA